jgi:hypothetical protein
MRTLILAMLLTGCGSTEPSANLSDAAADEDGSVGVTAEALTAGDWFVNNTDRNMNLPSRLTALAGVVRGALPQCKFHCYTDGETRRCNSTTCPSAQVYTYNCVTTGPNAERCDLGIGLATAGYMQWSGSLTPGNNHWDGGGRWGGCPNNVFSMDNTKTRVFPYCQ